MTIPENLISKLRERKVIPFVDAGVSRAVMRKGGKEALFPIWKELLEAVAEI